MHVKISKLFFPCVSVFLLTFHVLVCALEIYSLGTWNVRKAAGIGENGKVSYEQCRQRL